VAEKTKKQHFVAQSYLRHFSMPGKDSSLFVMDANSLKIYKANVEDVAERRYYYDLDYFDDYDSLDPADQQNLDKMVKEEFGKTIKELGPDEKLKINQSIEHYLDLEVDQPFSKFLDEIIASVYQGPLAARKKVHFLNDKKEKYYFAYLISKNFIRGKFFRDSTLSMREKVYKKLIVMQSAHEGKPIDEGEFSVQYPKEAGAIFQIQSLLDEKTVTNFASLFAARPWILVKNETPSPFITSDNLLSWVPTGEIPAFYGRGFGTEFTLWYLPISPTLAIEFEETQKAKDLEPYDLLIREQKDEKQIRIINRHIAAQSMSEIYSSTDHLNYLAKMFKKHPHKKDYGPTVL
jgi:hypothetical protein